MGIAPVFRHPWNLSPSEARALQQELRGRVREEVLSTPVRVAGVDVSVRGQTARAAVVILSFPDLEPLEAAAAEQPLTFPYVPGLLAFREGPAVLTALEKARNHPDVLIFDAQGLAHPRRMGLATHLGVLLDLPSVGCAKSRLCGDHEEPPQKRGSWVPLWDGGEVIGALGIHDDKGVREWSDDEIALVEAVTQRMSMAAENLRLLDETQHRESRERLTREITDEMRRATDLDTLIQTTVRGMAKALGTSSTFVQLSAPPESGENKDRNNKNDAGQE